MNERAHTLKLDFRSGLPIYIQIIDHFQQRVVSGALQTGDQLPTIRALALDLRVNFNTVARAYHMLDEAGIVSAQQGRGTYIVEIPRSEMARRIRRESHVTLARRYVHEAKRLNLSHRVIVQTIRDQLQEWKNGQMDNSVKARRDW